MNSFMWKDDKNNLMYDDASRDVDKFILDISKKRRLGFTYRENQHKFAKDIMNAIRDNKILLVQAGVGIGKSMGYLIPVFSTYKNVNHFNKVIISTSNIALQQQLLTDINYLSRLLHIDDIKVEVAKGVHTYVCLKSLDAQLNSSGDSFAKRKFRELEDDISNKKSVDKSELIDIGDRLWKEVQLKNNLSCSKCHYSRTCLYNLHLKELDRANVVITNHAYFVNAIESDNNVVVNADMYVFDEAHEIENAIRNVSEGEFMLYDFKKSIYYFIDNGFISDKNHLELTKNLINHIGILFNKIMRMTSNNFNNNSLLENIKITDCDKISVDGKEYIKYLDEIIKEYSKLIYKLREENCFDSITYRKYLKYLIRHHNLFVDLKRGKNSKRIYWADFFRQDRINLGFVSKDSREITDKIFGKNIPIVCTSATMLDANGSYNYFKEGLNLNSLAGRSIIDGNVYESPFDYKKNSWFYYDTSVSNPKDYNNYIFDLVDRIKKLISVTDGRTLVLFTAKSTMKKVYSVIANSDFEYKIMMQGDMDNDLLRKKFQNDIKSCLFATGSFWEGIDIKGDALSNVIITRLPFAVTDAIMENKASKYSYENGFKMVYLNDMVQKMAQGCGRLIRNKNDKGVICCLDSRIVKYLDSIKKCIPYVNYTSDINDIVKFSNKYIKKLEKK